MPCFVKSSSLIRERFVYPSIVVTFSPVAVNYSAFCGFISFEAIARASVPTFERLFDLNAVFCYSMKLSSERLASI